mgnify:CR=1 FL=1
MRDKLYYEVKEYRDRFRDCNASYILARMGESRNFFYRLMSKKDLTKYHKIRLSLDEKI